MTQANIDLSNLTSDQGFTIHGTFPLGEFGKSVSSAGDVNGDGVDDLIIGAPTAENNLGTAVVGSAYVIYGRIGNSPADLDVNEMDPDQGFLINIGANMSAGRSVSSVGDINGDGLDDVIVGVPGFSLPGNSSMYAMGFAVGGAFIVYGELGTSRSQVDALDMSVSRHSPSGLPSDVNIA